MYNENYYFQADKPHFASHAMNSLAILIWPSTVGCWLSGKTSAYVTHPVVLTRKISWSPKAFLLETKEQGEKFRIHLEDCDVKDRESVLYTCYLRSFGIARHSNNRWNHQRLANPTEDESSHSSGQWMDIKSKGRTGVKMKKGCTGFKTRSLAMKSVYTWTNSSSETSWEASFALQSPLSIIGWGQTLINTRCEWRHGCSWDVHERNPMESWSYGLSYNKIQYPPSESIPDKYRCEKMAKRLTLKNW